MEPDYNCQLCPRLVNLRHELRNQFPDWHNGPVADFRPSRENSAMVELLVVGLAPGLRGANRTARPFTGDYAGDLLYDSLKAYGFARGDYKATAEDGLILIKTVITNAVRCVPPDNRPNGSEINNCRQYLMATINGYNQLKVILTLGHIAHNSVISALGLVKSQYKFKHGLSHKLGDSAVRLFNSYHPSRYNINTGRLTEPQFKAVIADIRRLLATGDQVS